MRIDGHLPLFHFSEVVAVGVAAPAERVYHALLETTLADVSPARRALRLLGWFSLLPFVSAPGRHAPAAATLIDRLEAAGFTRLDDIAARELVLGAMIPRAASPWDFRERVLRGESALVISIHLDPDALAPATRLAVELRASMPDEMARRRYAPRAEMARLAIRRILGDAMSAVKRNAERAAGGTTRDRDGA